MYLAAVSLSKLWGQLGADLVAPTCLVKVSGKESDQPSVPGYRQLPQAWCWCLNRSLGSSRSNLMS